MGSFVSNLEDFFKQKSVLSNLIAINILVFLVLKIISVIGMLFNFQDIFIDWFIELPADFMQLLRRPWTLISYMFVHYGFWHVLFNLLWLYWFGKLFLYFFQPRQLGGLYVLGGIAGALLFVLAYNIFPYFQESIANSYLIGASASVMAIVFATAFYRKDFEISLLFIGRIKLIYIAVFCLILDLISIQSDNPGGHIAHIGGALMGIWFAVSYQRGKDLTAWINLIIDKVVNFLFKEKAPKKKVRVHYKRPTSDIEYNTRKTEQNAKIDRILDKIKQSGYNSLTEDEKKTLFDAGKK
ncbi:rhomboid family intramembrane serine protease [Bacteroidales bacterium OttesenSCG-928-A17]|nr:rhomboid family intramembrane serine protease [Bacteroidales bacterium OttesenSCG-928-A17]